MKRRLVILVTFIGGLYYFLEFFLPGHMILGRADFQWSRFEDDYINLGIRVFGSMGAGLGVINLLRVHGYALLRRRKGWPNSLVLIVAMFVTMFVGFWGLLGGNEAADACFWQFFFSGLMNNLAPAMFSLLAFYIASAAYRSFRIQNMEAGLMMVAALLVMFGQIPLGFFVYEGLPTARNWMLSRLSTPAFRGIGFGAAVAGLAMGVRMWLSLDQASSQGGR